MSRVYEQVVTVPLSASESAVFGVRGADQIGVHVPAITSAQAFVQCAPSSAGPFGRLLRTDGSTVQAFNTGAGSLTFALAAAPFAFAKVEFGVPQAAVRSLSVTTRF